MALLSLAVAVFGFLFCAADSLSAQTVPSTVSKIRIEGNETIPEHVILQKVLTQPGRQVTSRQIREDKRNLMSTRWFYSVEERFEETDSGSVLIFRVHERPIVRRVEFRGVPETSLNFNAIKTKHLESWTGLKVGSPFDHLANREAVKRIEQEYKEKGHYHVKVQLLKGGEPSDREVIFQIDAGPKVRVQDRTFRFVRPNPPEGMSDTLTELLNGRRSEDGTLGLSPTAGRLTTKLQSKKALLGFWGGYFKPETMDQDIDSLKQYYRGLGFFDVQVQAEPFFSKAGDVRIVYTIDEGVPYRVRNISLNGNNVIPVAQLRDKAQLTEGKFFNSLPLSHDVEHMLSLYAERGHYFASVIPVPKFTEQAGVVDLVFEIDEDRPRYVRNVNGRLIGDHPHTMEVVLLNYLQMEPGDLANPKLIRRGQSRLNGSGLFEGVQAEVVPVENSSFMTASNSRTIRGQTALGYSPSWTAVLDPPRENDSLVPLNFGHSMPGLHSQQDDTAVNCSKPNQSSSVDSDTDHPDVSFIPSSQFDTVLDYTQTAPQSVFLDVPTSLLVSSFPDSVCSAGANEEPIIRAQSPGGFYAPPIPGRGDAVLQGSPYNNQFQALPPGWVDINVAATEGRTGRLMFGAGVNSDAGLVGSFVWDERNFNLFRPPQTFADIIEGRAWRGGGQRFRLEAAPGDQVSRYSLSWTDPYFMYSDYSLSVSGFYFNRFYPDWDETRLGGRVAIGRQLTPEWSINGALRLEDVEIANPRIITGSAPPSSVPELEAVRGNNFLSTFRASISHDTRDSTLLPSEGHFVDLAYEQAFGDFNYPRLETELRQYITMYNRADGSGRHVLTFAGNIGWSGDDTPVFERYYAGGFQSFRGFAFRGGTPRGADNISTGGTWQLLGTSEYRLPLTADDMINLVVFSDVGTVNQDVTIDNFRVTVGVGLRVVVPAMGPVPLAFDFGFPVRSAKFDDERIFSFYVGINR